MSKNQRPLPQPLRFRQRRSGNLPRPVQLVNNFFSNPEVFFSERAARISPRRRSGNLSRPLLAVNRFLLLFSKNLFAPPSRPLGPARLSETFRPAAARTGYAPPRRLCQRLFIFFLIFLPHTPRFYRVFAPVRAPKNCYLEIPPQEYPALPPKGRFSAFGQRKSPPQIRRRAFQAFWCPASYWIRTSTVVLLILTTLADTGARVNSNTRRVLSSWCPRRMPEIQRSLGTRGSWMPQLP